jgi:hypothetical protein
MIRYIEELLIIQFKKRLLMSKNVRERKKLRKQITELQSRLMLLKLTAD